MALLDFMKEGFNSLQSQPQMYDPHANAKRLMVQYKSNKVVEQDLTSLAVITQVRMHKSHYLKWMLQEQLVVKA